MGSGEGGWIGGVGGRGKEQRDTGKRQTHQERNDLSTRPTEGLRDPVAYIAGYMSLAQDKSTHTAPRTSRVDGAHGAHRGKGSVLQ